MGRRTLLLITSILLAAVGTALVAIYVKGADSRAQKGQALVSVLVVKTEVAAGTAGTALQQSGNFASESWPKSNVPPGALSGLSQIGGQYAASKLLVGQVLQAAMFSKSANTAADSVGVSANHVGMAFQLSDPQRVAGTLEPGMLVTIYKVPQQGNVLLLEQDVKVLKIGNQSTAASTDSSSASSSDSTSNSDDVARAIVTFDLTDKEVKAMLEAQQNGGELSLAVQPNGNGSAS